MAEGKMLHCPTCGSSLVPGGNQANVKCEYCGNNVIVPAELRQGDLTSLPGANPISIFMNDSGTSVQVADPVALQSKAMNILVDSSGVPMETTVSMPAGVSRWIKFSIWMFVIVTVVSVVVPIACSFLGIFGAMAGAFLPFFLR